MCIRDSHKGVVCSPADPNVDSKAFEALAGATHSDPSEWGYALKDGVEVHAAAQPNAPVIDKLGLNPVSYTHLDVYKRQA